MLVEQGADVTVLARPTSDVRHLKGLPIAISEGTLIAAESLRKAVAGCTHIFHCAACSTDWAGLQTYIDANVTGTQNLLEAAAGLPALQRFVHVSTTDVYGYPALPGDETMPLVETDLPYNRTKVQGERAVWKAAAAGLPVTVVRPATIYGPRGKDFTVEVAKLLRQRLMATVDSGTAAGGFIYVDDVAAAMIAAASSAVAVRQAYNLADGSATTWERYLSLFAGALHARPPWINLSFASAMRLATAMELPHRYGLPGKPLLTRHAVYLLGRSQEFSANKARQDLGWTPRVGVEEGIARSVRWLNNIGS